MCDDTQGKSPASLVSIRRVPTFGSTPVSTSCSEGIDNPALDLNDTVEVEKNPSGPRRPLTPKIQTRQEQLKGLKQALYRVSSLATNKNSTPGKKKGLPNAADFSRSWDNIEQYLQKQSKDSKKLEGQMFSPGKPFYRRTWFSCTISIIILLILVGVILAVAVEKAIIFPNTLIKGQIPPALLEKSRERPRAELHGAISPDYLQDDAAVTAEDDAVEALNQNTIANSPVEGKTETHEFKSYPGLEEGEVIQEQNADTRFDIEEQNSNLQLDKQGERIHEENVGLKLIKDGEVIREQDALLQRIKVLEADLKLIKDGESVREPDAVLQLIKNVEDNEQEADLKPHLRPA